MTMTHHRKVVRHSITMGLDQYAIAVSPEVAPLLLMERELTAEERKRLEENKIDVFYWRKHADLNQWMQNLYESKGGSEEFNCVYLPLTEEDIEALEEQVNTGRYDQTGVGFFWGKSEAEDIEQDKKFIQQAKRMFAEGFELFYSCWW